jgi:hypothetical protein
MTNDTIICDATSTDDMTSESTYPRINRDEVLSFARMPETGDYAADCEIGRNRADELIAWMAETSFTPALAAVVQEMMSLGRWTANHIGFFQRLADRSLPAPT